MSAIFHTKSGSLSSGSVRDVTSDKEIWSKASPLLFVPQITPASIHAGAVRGSSRSQM